MIIMEHPYTHTLIFILFIKISMHIIHILSKIAHMIMHMGAHKTTQFLLSSLSLYCLLISIQNITSQELEILFFRFIHIYVNI